MDRLQNRSQKKRLGLIGAAVILLVACAVLADYWTAVPSGTSASFVGRDQCISCHQDQTDAFTGSHHDKAMDFATVETVLGDFDDATIEHYGVTSRLFRDGDRFMINTEGPDGKMQDFHVKYVFGVEPLQQYMVELDRPDDAKSDVAKSQKNSNADHVVATTRISLQSEQPETDLTSEAIGRVQVLRISWDTANQRWFYLSPPDVDEKLAPDDPLHWTGIAQRWQTMCANCHSTNLQENFDPTSNRYHTTYSEIDVSCESCHGPGSLHVELANKTSLFWDRNHGYGLAKLKGDDPEPQLQACAPCHSRRGVLSGDYSAGDPFCNHFQLETMREDTYHADGQIKDEVYVYGSFIQSKMYHKGIRCTDCHDPHSLELKHKGNETCTSCHQHSAGKYDVPSHHHHAVGTAGSMCVNCHMPHTTYMGVDKRRDHSLRVPRPDLSVSLGTPNACSHCHVEDQLQSLSDDAKQLVKGKEYADWIRLADQDDELAGAIATTDRWCDEACEKWYGESRKQPKHYAETIANFRRGRDGSIKEMLELAMSSPAEPSAVPDMARASIYRELAESGINMTSASKPLVAEIEDKNNHPMVRASAIAAIANAAPDRAREVIMKMLSDDSRLVRIEAAQTLINTGIYRSLTGAESLQVDPILDTEVYGNLMQSNDRAGAHITWAMVQEQRGNYREAIEAYQTAIRIEPNTTGARTNLAGLLDNLAENPESGQAEELRASAKKLRKDELPLLGRDADLAPTSAPLQYRYGLALYLDGQMEAALERLNQAVDLQPDAPTFKQARDLLQEKIDNEGLE